MSDDRKTGRQLCYIILMTHPDDFLFRQSLKKRRRRIYVGFRLAKFAAIGMTHFPTQRLGHELHAITKTKYRDSQFKYIRFYLRSIFFIHTSRAACKNNSLRLQLLDFCYGFMIRIYFTVYMIFTDTTCNELIVLSAKIDNNDKFFVIHYFLLLYIPGNNLCCLQLIIFYYTIGNIE